MYFIFGDYYEFPCVENSVDPDQLAATVFNSLCLVSYCFSRSLYMYKTVYSILINV